VRSDADALRVAVALAKSGTDGDLRVSAEISRNGQGLAAMISGGNALRAACGLCTDSSAGPGPLPTRTRQFRLYDSPASPRSPPEGSLRRGLTV
jgi:hypothetical protein